jgi:hypothetical protein
VNAGQTHPLSGLPLAVLFDALDFVRWPTAVLARLVNDCRRQQLRGIELTNGESLKPCLLSACQTVHLRATDVPELDVNAVRTTLAEQ